MKLQRGACAITDMFSLLRRQIRNIFAYCVQIINQELKHCNGPKVRRYVPEVT